MMFQIAGTAVFCCLTAGCGSSLPPPNDEWAQAQTDVGRAEAGGAPSVPDAKLHLQLAAEDLQKSRDLMGQDNRRAASLIGLARAEAQRVAMTERTLEFFKTYDLLLSPATIVAPFPVENPRAASPGPVSRTRSTGSTPPATSAPWS